MRELWEALRRGAPSSRQALWRGLELLGALALFVFIVVAPFIAQELRNPWYRGIVWIAFILLMVTIAVSLGLMPYFGMREIKRDKEKDLSRSIRSIEDTRNNLGTQINSLTEQIKPYRDVSEKQDTNPGRYLWAGMNPIKFR